MISLLSPDLSPSDLSLPPKFSSFRPAQIEALEWLTYGANPEIGPKPFMLGGLPPGIGKSVLAQAVGSLSGVKYAVLTATRALEAQATADFRSMGLVNIQGKSNYQCREPKTETDDSGKVISSTVQTCEEGEDNGCEFAGTPRCTRGARYEEAKRADAILLNYACWIHTRARGVGSMGGQALELPSNPIKLLICDEAHICAGILSSFLGIWVGDRDLKQYVDKEVRDCLRSSAGADWGRVTKPWIEMLDALYGQADARRQQIEHQIGSQALARKRSKEYRRLSKLLSNLERVLEHGGDNNWIWRQTSRPGPGISFDCIWPGRYAPRYLWSGVERVILLSASLRPKHGGLLGLGSTQYSFKEWPRQFPAKLNPVYWIPTGKMGMKTDPEERLRGVQAHDAIIEAGWGQFKGLVHTGSYARAEWLQANSKYGRRMILPSQGSNGLTAGQAFEKHVQSVEPTTLVGPVYHTGWDMPDDTCRWIHWLKLPYPDRSDPIVQARAESDPEWYDCETMQSFVQGNGRGQRHEKDWAFVFCTDDAIRNFRNYARQFAPGWSRVTDAPGGKIPEVPGWLTAT